MTKNNTKSEPILVTRAVVPTYEEYASYIEQVFSSRYLTNEGELSKKLEKRLSSFLNIPHLALCANGTLALQLALRAAGIEKGEVITTPFSYVATVSSLLWEGFTPVFADIDAETLCICPKAIEQAITERTVGIMPVHIYGNACDVASIGSIAKKYGITTIYDAAQAFGSMYKGAPVASYGDFAILSFHATKVFHTVEGGAVVCHDQKAYARLGLLRAFGHIGDEHISLGINAKMSELHAAMGLCLLSQVEANIANRKKVSQQYDNLLPAKGLRKPVLAEGLDYNYAYYPVIFDTQEAMQNALADLNSVGIFPRRYFYPSLNTLPYLKTFQPCPIAEDICTRILCLPLYAELENKDVERIAKAIKHR